MPILAKSEAPPAEVLCVREVRVGIPAERLGEIQGFYTLALGLESWPEEMQIPGGWGLGDPQCGLYLQLEHDPQIDPMRRRLMVTVPSLAALEERLIEREWRYERVHGLGWSDQHILVHDPAGNLIEVRQSQPL